MIDRPASQNISFEVESLPGHNARPDVARSIVQAGWNLLELKLSTHSLEEVFLELTGATPDAIEAVADSAADSVGVEK